MKKILLVVFLLGAAFAGQAQIKLSEFYTNPSGSERQFFELFNSGTSAVNLSCYTLFVYDPTSKAFWAVTLPSFSLAPQSYFVASSATTFNITGQSGLTADFNWNSGTVQKYTPTGSNQAPFYTITTATPIDLLLKSTYEYYLFDASGGFLDGFIGNSNGTTSFNTTKSMTVTAAGCTTYTLDWKNTVPNKVNGETSNTGSSNGFAANIDGSCKWGKTATSPAPTPGFPNVPKNLTTPTGYSASFSCGTLSYTIPSSASTPLYVDIYTDANKNKVVDVGDTKQSSTLINSVPVTNTISSLSTSQYYVLYFRSSTGCVAGQTPILALTGNLRAENGSLKCNQTAKFTLPGITTGDSAQTSYASIFPITAQLYFNNTAVSGATATVSSFSPSTYISITGYTIPSNTSSPEIRLSSASAPCFSATIPLTNTTATVTVGGSINCTVDPQTGQRSASYNLVTTATDNPDAYPLTVTMYEDANKDGNISGDAILGSTHYTTASGTSHIQPLNNPNSYIIVTGVSDLAGCANTIDAIDNTCTVLPIKLKSFTAVRKEDKVNLAWVTEMEQNNKGFYVQRSLGGEWKDIAFVFTQAQEGTSTQELSYSYTDLNPAKGMSQYRILQVDLDGKGMYSQIRSVNGTTASGKLLLYPNPSNTGAVTLVFGNEGAKSVTVSDVSGRLVQQFKNISGSSLEVKNLTSGFYTVQVRDAATGSTATEKFIITKR